MAKELRKTKKMSIDMKITLIAFALIPMIISAIVISTVLILTSSSELKESTRDSMEAIIVKTGQSFDYSVQYSCQVMKAYSEAPVIMEYLKNPNDEELAAKAEEYTVDFFGTLEGWEGIYLADWNSKVLAHPAAPVVGKVMREGEKLKELQDAMLTADGVYNVGIITSPASGQLIDSLYYPIYDSSKKPLGYVGAGTFVADVVSQFSDVSSLNMSTAYMYFVDSDATMLYHPNEEKIGKPAENEAVKSLVARIAAGEHPEPDCMEYKYKGAMKYAAYYVGNNEHYIAVLTADEAEVMKNIQKNIWLMIIICAVCIAIFATLALIVAKTVSKPLAQVAMATNQLSTGDVTVECNAKSPIKETASIIKAFDNLKNALNSSMANVKQSAMALNTAIVSVDGMTNNK